jgi:hypothetical protein
LTRVINSSSPGSVLCRERTRILEKRNKWVHLLSVGIFEREGERWRETERERKKKRKVKTERERKQHKGRRCQSQILDVKTTYPSLSPKHESVNKSRRKRD